MLKAAASSAQVVLKPTEMDTVLLSAQKSGSSAPSPYSSYGCSATLALDDGPFAYLRRWAAHSQSEREVSHAACAVLASSIVRWLGRICVVDGGRSGG